jgi:hypothetical protein
MSERTVEDIRTEMVAERQRLDDDLNRLKSDLRSLAVFVVAGLVVVGLVTWLLGKRSGAQTVWKLVK